MHKKLILLFLLVISTAISAAEVGAGNVVAKPLIYSEEQQKLLQQFKDCFDEPLSSAHVDDVDRLLKNGIHPDDITAFTGRPILFPGIESNNILFVKKLLEQGADPNIKYGIYSALEKTESIAMAKLLLAHKAKLQRSIYFKDFGPTLLFIDTCKKVPSLALLYWNRGVSPLTFNSHGDSALDSYMRSIKSMQRLEELIPYCIAMEMPFRKDLIERCWDEEDAKRIHAALTVAQSEHSRAKERAADLPGILNVYLLPRLVPIIQAYDGPAIAPAVAQKLLEIEDMKDDDAKKS